MTAGRWSAVSRTGDEWAALVYQAQALQIAKGVGIMLGCFHER